MLEAYCVECDAVRVIAEQDNGVTCCECDGPLEITAKWGGQ